MKKTALITAFTALLCVLLCVLLCACSQGGGKALSEVWSDIKAEVKFEDFNEYSDISKLERNYGITADMAEEFAGGINGSGVNQEEIVLVKAKDDKSAAEIRGSLENRYSSKLAQNKNYNAEQAKVIENCRVEQNGLYVSMIVSENVDKITEIYKNDLGLD